MTTPATPAPSFNLARIHEAEQSSIAMPDETVDGTPEKFFSGPWNIEEINALMIHLRFKPVDSATGFGGRDMSYSFILQIPVEHVKELYDECILLRSTPRIWLTTILVGVLQRSKSRLEPTNYRIIALECCLLKGLTWLIESRFRAWANARNIIPKNQNGFQPGRRTNISAFILRTLSDWASSSRRKLYVAFVDLQNAFPSVNHALLWRRLDELGASGPMVDLMRRIYSRMTYLVQLGNDQSGTFASDIGILAGDPCSGSYSPVAATSRGTRTIPY